MNLNALLTPKPAENYADLTNGGNYQIDLNQQEACVALKVHDYGLEALTHDEKTQLYSMIGKLKDQIWP